MTKTTFRAAGLALSGHDILRDLDFELSPGEWTFLVGPPACGKTLLLDLAAGRIAPTSGKIARAGKSATILHDTPLDDTKSARAIVAEAMGGDAEAAERLLCDLGLDAYLNHEPFRLSRGHRKRLAIAHALAGRPALLCLDDPFAPLDRAARARTAGVLGRAADEDGLAILMSCNDPLDALRYADRILVLSPGPAARIIENIAHEPGEAGEAELLATPLYARLDAAMRAEP